MLNIIIFGPPGSGKGTQSAKIVEKYHLTHISTGDLLRDEMKRKTTLGKEISKYIDSGMLVPDDIVIRELQHTVKKNCDRSGFVFDGFPRTLNQAEMLDNMLICNEMPVNIVISVDVNENELMKRLLGRAEDSGRSDDNEEVIWKRIDVYKSQSFPLISYYSKQEKLVRVNGMDPVEKVFEKITLAIDTYLLKNEILVEVN
jgi:adenylate kinase